MRKILSALLFLSLAAGSFGAYAYLAAQAKADNLFDPGDVTTVIEEEFNSPDDLRPGDNIKKRVTVTNTGNNDCFVRARALFSDSLMQDVTSLDFNTVSWQYSASDGWWYLTSSLSPGSTSPPLFTAVKIPESADPDSLIPFDIYVCQESRQSHGASSYMTAWA